MVSALMPTIFLQAGPATAVAAAAVATAAVVTMAMVNFSSGQRNLVKTFHNQANYLLILKKMVVFKYPRLSRRSVSGQNWVKFGPRSC